MTSRTYAQIECSITGSRKIRGLSSHQARWAYLCAHLSDFATYTGLFKYPRHMWAHDAQLTPEELDAAIEELIEVELIDFDSEEDFVRIVGWHHKRSGPDNRNRIYSVINDFVGNDAIPSEMYCAAAAELTVASLRRAQRWKPDSSARDKLYQDLRSFTLEVYQDYGDPFITALKAEAEAVSASVLGEALAIFPAANILKPKPLGNPSGTLAEHETRRDEDETKTKRNSDSNETTHFSTNGVASSAAPVQMSEVLRKGRSPSTSALHSELAQSARAS